MQKRGRVLEEKYYRCDRSILLIYFFYLRQTPRKTTVATIVIDAMQCWRRCCYLSRKLNNKRQRGKKAGDAKKKDIVRFFSFDLINPVLQFQFYLHNTHHTTTTTIVAC